MPDGQERTQEEYGTLLSRGWFPTRACRTHSVPGERGWRHSYL